MSVIPTASRYETHLDYPLSREGVFKHHFGLVFIHCLFFDCFLYTVKVTVTKSQESVARVMTTSSRTSRNTMPKIFCVYYIFFRNVQGVILFLQFCLCIMYVFGLCIFLECTVQSNLSNLVTIYIANFSIVILHTYIQFQYRYLTYICSFFFVFLYYAYYLSYVYTWGTVEMLI